MSILLLCLQSVIARPRRSKIEGMLRRFVFVLLLVMPLAVQADDGAVVTAPVQVGSSLQPTGGGDSTPQTLNLLQPADAGSSASALQSADATSGGVAQSTTQDLQQTGSSNQTSLMVQGEGDQPHTLSSGNSVTWLGYAVIVLLVACAITAVAWLWQRRRA